MNLSIEITVQGQELTIPSTSDVKRLPVVDLTKTLALQIKANFVFQGKTVYYRPILRKQFCVEIRWHDEIFHDGLHKYNVEESENWSISTVIGYSMTNVSTLGPIEGGPLVYLLIPSFPLP